MIVFSLFVQAAEGSTTALCLMSALGPLDPSCCVGAVEALLLLNSVARFRQLA
jgi:hypothetical protein